MKKTLTIVLVLLFLCTYTLAEGADLSTNWKDGAVRFTALPGIYIVGEDFPAGTYEIKCADGTSLINIVIDDVEGKSVLRGDFWSNKNEMIGKIKLLEGYAVNVSDGSAYFAPSAGGILFDIGTSVSEGNSSDEPLKHDAAVKNAMELLKSFWLDSYQIDGISKNGYLEIKNTRVVEIKNEFTVNEDGLGANANQYFGNVDYIVEFILFSDYFGSVPYYSNANINDCVIVMKDGTYSIGRNPFDLYRSRTYNSDYSWIIANIYDYGTAYNAVFELLK